MVEGAAVQSVLFQGVVLPTHSWLVVWGCRCSMVVVGCFEIGAVQMRFTESSRLNRYLVVWLTGIVFQKMKPFALFPPEACWKKCHVKNEHSVGSPPGSSSQFQSLLVQRDCIDPQEF